MNEDHHVLKKLRHWIRFHWTKVRAILIFISFVISAMIAALIIVPKWSFVNAFYFAISSLSTGGHFALPSGQEDWVYAITGVYAALGIPVMALAMATMASFFISGGNSISATFKQIRAPVSEHEVNMLTEFGMV